MKREIARRTGIIAFFTIISRISGLVRDATAAYAFGAAASADAFYVAFRIPNLLRRLLAEGALTTSFVPVFTDVLKENREEARKVVNITFTLLALVMTAVVGLGILGSDFLVRVSAHGFTSDPEKFGLTVAMTRLVFPYIGFISLMALAMGVLNSLNRFAAPAFSPVLLNLSLIFGAMVLSRFFAVPVYGLALGALLGGILQFACQLPSLRKVGMLPRLDFSFSHPSVKEIGRLMLPQVYGAAVYQFNVFIINFFASYSAGAVTYLWYSGRVMEFPLGVFAIAMATAILPSFSEYASLKDEQKFRETLLFGMEAILWINLPATVGLYLLSEPITAFLFHRGAFTGEDVVETARALQAFMLGLPFISGTRVLVSAYYALKKPRIPVVMATVTVVVNLLLCFFLRHSLGHVGLALATSLSSMVNFIGLTIWISRYVPDLCWKDLMKPLGRILLSSAAMGLGIYILCQFMFPDYLHASTGSLGLKTVAVILAGTALYVLTNLRNPLMQTVFRSVKRKLKLS